MLSEAHVELWRNLCGRSGFESPRIVFGGASRWESVRHAVMSLDITGAGDVITVHDGARPLVEERVIRETVLAAAADGVDGAIPVVPVTDSVRIVSADGTSRPVARQSLRAVQTPQAFPAGLLREAYGMPFSPDFTDDASVMSAFGHGNIVLTAGSSENIKITHPSDLALAGYILASRVEQEPVTV